MTISHISESFLHYVWKFGHFDKINLKSVTGKTIKIVSPGIHNFDAGPDFLNAKVIIDNVVWYGNVEIHISSSDWLKHGHSIEEGYSNLILHVVYFHDREIEQINKKNIPTIEINSLIDPNIFSKYLSLSGSANPIPCQKELTNVSDISITGMIEKSAIERLAKKAEEIERILIYTQNDWEACLYILIAKYLGVRVNMDPFERLARSVSLKIIRKHLDDLNQVEALLYGQSGLLPSNGEDAYVQTLFTEYTFLQKKYGLKTLDKSIWKFARMRPIGFPTIRISFLANLLFNQDFLFSKVLKTSQPQEILKLLNCQSSTYWLNHYVFGKESKPIEKRLGLNTKSVLIINAIAPLLYHYGLKTGSQAFIDRSIVLLEMLKPEENKIMRSWKELNIYPNDAFQSQGLLELYNNYCVVNRCIDCRIGHQIMTNK